jgi:hypothetical protein
MYHLSTVNFKTFQISKAFPFTALIFVRKIHVKPIFYLENLKLNYDTCTSAMTVVGNHKKFSGCTLRVKIILM